MDDLELERLIDGIAIILARRSDKQKAAWIIRLIERIINDQVNVHHTKNRAEWIRDIGRACADLFIEYGDD